MEKWSFLFDEQPLQPNIIGLAYLHPSQPNLTFITNFAHLNMNKTLEYDNI